MSEDAKRSFLFNKVRDPKHSLPSWLKFTETFRGHGLLQEISNFLDTSCEKFEANTFKEGNVQLAPTVGDEMVDDEKRTLGYSLKYIKNPYYPNGVKTQTYLLQDYLGHFARNSTINKLVQATADPELYVVFYGNEDTWMTNMHRFMKRTWMDFIATEHLFYPTDLASMKD